MTSMLAFNSQSRKCSVIIFILFQQKDLFFCTHTNSKEEEKGLTGGHKSIFGSFQHFILQKITFLSPYYISSNIASLQRKKICPHQKSNRDLGVYYPIKSCYLLTVRFLGKLIEVTPSWPLLKNIVREAVTVPISFYHFDNISHIVQTFTIAIICIRQQNRSC